MAWETTSVSALGPENMLSTGRLTVRVGSTPCASASVESRNSASAVRRKTVKVRVCIGNKHYPTGHGLKRQRHCRLSIVDCRLGKGLVRGAERQPRAAAAAQIWAADDVVPAGRRDPPETLPIVDAHWGKGWNCRLPIDDCRLAKGARIR